MQKIKHLEGLRGIAALIVLLSHLISAFFTSNLHQLLATIINCGLPVFLKHFITDIIIILTDADLAVWIFWALSAYVISIAFFKPGKHYNNTLIGSIVKRYTRLVIPVFCAVIFAYLLLKSGMMYNRQVPIPGGSTDDWLNRFYLFDANLFAAVKLAVFTTFFQYQYSLNASSYDVVLWTIGPEFLGSVFIFSLFHIVRHNPKRYILYFIIAIIIAALQQLSLLIFVTGYAMCDYDFSNSGNKLINSIKKIETKIHKYRLPFFIASILFIILGYGIMEFMHVPSGWYQLILSCAILYFCLRNEYYKKALSLKIPVWLGKISFSLYLIHFPVICSLTSFMVLRNNTFKGRLIASLITIIVVFGLSDLYAKYIDKKAVVFANKLGHWFHSRQPHLKGVLR